MMTSDPQRLILQFHVDTHEVNSFAILATSVTLKYLAITYCLGIYSEEILQRHCCL